MPRSTQMEREIRPLIVGEREREREREREILFDQSIHPTMTAGRHSPTVRCVP